MEAAERLYDTLLPWRDQVVWTGTRQAGRWRPRSGGWPPPWALRRGRAELAQGLDVHRRLEAPGPGRPSRWSPRPACALTRRGAWRTTSERAELVPDEAAELARHRWDSATIPNARSPRLAHAVSDTVVDVLRSDGPPLRGRRRPSGGEGSPAGLEQVGPALGDHQGRSRPSK